MWTSLRTTRDGTEASLMREGRRLPAHRGIPIEVVFNGVPIPCFSGETVATALLAAGTNEFGRTRAGDPRQPLCNMGTCFDCVVVVDGAPLIRSCLTYAKDGMNIDPSEGECDV